MTQIHQNNVSISKFNADDIKAQMSVAAMTTMAKAQGQELTKEDQDEMLKQAKAQMAGGVDLFGAAGAAGSGDAGEQGGTPAAESKQ